ncbi:NAD-dependent dehydratase [Paenibacillus sp. GD4]|uniref:NAD-dependent dehydratase n=1 Tax=Paenibacillus sp. GD4 TaxID=3068890 RepID=UPI0027963CF7|nr:NAD-dependent dehydratase [Paenibacillus sp. GD4]MDQ1911955.1 NAD-dependent dehydratase [Paenibacillus sp. GD4]
MNNQPFDLIFGTGPLGRSVMVELLGYGRKVRMANTSGKASGLPGDVEVVRCNAYAVEEVEACCRGARVVYVCVQPPYHEWPQKFPSLIRSIAEGVMRTGAKLVLGDNLYMYGQTVGSIHEELPYAATTRKGKVRSEVARYVLGLHQKGNLQTVIGRGSDFFGPYVLGSTLGSRVFPALLQGKACSLIGHIDLPHTFTYIGDFGKSLVLLGETESAYGQAWHVPNAPTMTPRQVAELAYRLAGKQPKIRSMGRVMIAIGGLFIKEARESMEMMYAFEQPYVVDSSKFFRTFGDISSPWETSLQATLDWYASLR